MGRKVEAYFKEAQRRGGIGARMKLAILTRMSPKKALEAPDDEATLQRFEDAMAKLKAQKDI